MTSRPTAPEVKTVSAITIKEDSVLDCKGLLCPLPVYQTSRAMARLAPGQILRIECTDPGSLEDFRAFARQQRHTLLAAEDRGGVQVFLLRKEGGP
jgi:TusA-related sulfurtransferase